MSCGESEQDAIVLGETLQEVLAGATGLEPDSGGFSNLLMARDFRRKPLRICCLVPVFDSPGVPSSPLESSAVLETFWRRSDLSCMDRWA